MLELLAACVASSSLLPAGTRQPTTSPWWFYDLMGGLWNARWLRSYWAFSDDGHLFVLSMMRSMHFLISSSKPPLTILKFRSLWELANIVSKWRLLFALQRISRGSRRWFPNVRYVEVSAFSHPVIRILVSVSLLNIHTVVVIHWAVYDCLSRVSGAVRTCFEEGRQCMLNVCFLLLVVHSLSCSLCCCSTIVNLLNNLLF